MPMSELERKAAFKSTVTLKETTMDAAARDVMGVTFHHLMEGLAGRRTLSETVRDRFCDFIGETHERAFGPKTTDAALNESAA